MADWFTYFGLLNLFNYNTSSRIQLFTGREYDKETQLYFLRARYYSPSTGRFISRDPIGQNDQINLYTYVANSPMMYVDKDGRIKEAINNGISRLAAVGTFLGIGAVGLFDSSYYYGDAFLGYSLIGTTELKYYNGSDYVKELKKTEDYTNLIETITDILNNGSSLEFGGSDKSTDTLNVLTLGKYNYSIAAEKKDDYFDVNIKITDTYDFNKEDNNGTLLNWYLNKMHDANKSGVLTPISVEININQKIPYEKN